MNTKPARALLFIPGMSVAFERVKGFEHIQELCGGFVERVVLDWDKGPSVRVIELWCNEDGISQGLPLNVWAEGPAYAGAPIVGPAVLVAGSVDADGESELYSLTDEEVARWSGLKRAVVVEHRECPECRRMVPADELSWTHDRHGIPWRKVCEGCWRKVTNDISGWKFNAGDAGERLEEDDE